MTDGVLAAIIAACATVLTSFLQLRSSFARDGAARGQPGTAARRKSRLPMVIVSVMLGGAAVGGFALSQWMTEHERTVQNELLHGLQERIATMTRTENQLEQIRGTRADIEAGVMRKLGMDGVVVMATVSPCKPPLMVNTPALDEAAGASPTQLPSQAATSSSPPSTCTEAEASPIMLCAGIPANATVTDVELFVRAAESDVPWSNARVPPGHDFEQARFGEKPIEVTDGASSMKQVCESFTQWSTERARVARMRVRYGLSQ